MSYLLFSIIGCVWKTRRWKKGNKACEKIHCQSRLVWRQTVSAEFVAWYPLKSSIYLSHPHPYSPFERRATGCWSNRLMCLKTSTNLDKAGKVFKQHEKAFSIWLDLKSSTRTLTKWNLILWIKINMNIMANFVNKVTSLATLVLIVEIFKQSNAQSKSFEKFLLNFNFHSENYHR